MSNRRFMWMMVGVLVVLAVLSSVTLLFERRQAVKEERPDPSVYNARPSGYKGWMKTMEKAGLKVSIWRSDFDRLGEIPVRATMIIIAPRETMRDSGFGGIRRPMTEKSVEQLIEWVEEGNTLVFFDDFNDKTGKRLLLQAELVDLDKDEEQFLVSDGPVYRLKVPEEAEDYLHRHIREAIRSRSDLRLKPVSTEVLLRDMQGRPLIERRQLGNGRLILGTVPDLASNHYLFGEDNDNFQFFTNLVTAERKAILVNEFVHGYLQDPDLFSYYMKTPLSHVLFQLVFLFFVLLWFSFLPWRPIRRESEELDGVTMREFVQSMAGIYLRANAASLAVGPQMGAIEQTLRRRYRIEPDAPEDHQKLAYLLENLFADYDSQHGQVALDAIRKGRQVVNRRLRIPQDDLVKLSRQLSLIQERLDYGLRKRQNP